MRTKARENLNPWPGSWVVVSLGTTGFFLFLTVFLCLFLRTTHASNAFTATSLVESAA